MESDNKTFSIASQFYHRPILIPHHPHPLIHCYHKKEKEFTCNNPDCKKNEGDSFRCTFCNIAIHTLPMNLLAIVLKNCKCTDL